MTLSARKPVLLRLVTLLLVVAAIMKLVLKPRSETADQWKRLAQPSAADNANERENKSFWKVGKGQESLNEAAESQGDPTEAVPAVWATLEPIHLQRPLRIVHLDLKGAAPKIKYLEQIFPLLSSLGADGVLMEYEDMFPYENDLHDLRSPHAYSTQDIEHVKKLAKLSKLEVIPLVQVFGHFEFVLKHERFTHLREMEEFPNSLNPHDPGAMSLVMDIVTQILNRHPEARWLHIGADEVFGLGESHDSKNWLHRNNGDVGKMFLRHVTAVGQSILKRRPGIRLLMWDDMMRQISVDTLKESNLHAVASPMIWNYLPELDEKHIGNLISKYEDSGFRSVWFASAFKGASGIDQRWTPLRHHLQNHLSWLNMMDSMRLHTSISFQGIVLTGWQRYDHFTVLCELLPVSIPSLAMCLQTLKEGGFNEKVKSEVQHMLGCSLQVDKQLCEGSEAFPGSEVYHMVLDIHLNLQKQVEEMMNEHNLKGGFSRYHRKYKFANPRYLLFFREKLEKLLNRWETFLEGFRTQMEAVYFSDAVEEWMEENVNYHMNKLRDIKVDLDHIIKLKGRPKKQ